MTPDDAPTARSEPPRSAPRSRGEEGSGRPAADLARHRPRPYRPASWLPGPHTQSLGGRLLRTGRRIAYRRERLETPDGDFLDLDLAFDPGAGDRDDRRPVVLVLHGLEGSSDSGYVRVFCRRLRERGLRPAALNFRSRSGEPNRLRRFYHSGETDDPAFVLGRLRERWPRAPLGAAGFSLGGNALLKLLGELGSAARELVDAAAAISVPYRLGAGAEALEQGWMARLYTGYFLRSLRRSVRAKTRRYGHDFDLDRIARARSLREFDDAFTAPVHGFEDADDYYRRSSAARWLEGIRVPTLLVHARDDPFLPEGALPEQAIRDQPWLVPAITDRGGHVGFVEGETPWRAGFWAERETARFLARILGPEEAGREDAAGPGDDERPSRIESDEETT